MRYLIILALLSGCSTLVPVTPRFPDAPSSALGKCSDLDTVPDNVKLSGLTGTVVQNYGKFHECSIKNDIWNEWYQEQKKIFQGVSK